MAPARSTTEDWSCFNPTTISTRPSPRQPRDERVWIPQCAKQSRPSPIYIAANPPLLDLQSSKGLKMKQDEYLASPRDPEVVDLAAPSTWPRRARPRHADPAHHIAPPHVPPQCSARQPEMSFGILDYYIRDVSPLNSPELMSPSPKLEGIERCVSPLESPTTALPASKLDPAIERFDFGLPLLLPYRSRASSTSAVQAPSPDAQAGAAKESPASAKLTRTQHEKGYSLFPTVHKSVLKPNATEKQNETVPPSDFRVGQTNQQPNPSYRPRKESVTSSIRSRKDSCTSFRSSRQIPLHILSKSSTASANTHSTGSVSARSPPQHSRWSDETIKSPTAATTPGLRASFGSVMGRDSVQYPACFFEDEDERVPLRSKSAWKRSISLTHERLANRGKGRFDEKRSFGRRVARALLCTSCCA